MPKKYVEKVGDEGFKKAPIGAGPYKFVSFTPGVELVLEAFEQYWRKTPAREAAGASKVIPDETTRLAALKRGEVDIAYSIRGELAEELQRTPGLTLKPAVIQATFWLYFADQWDPKSPWHDQRVRQAASLAHRPPGHQPGADPRLLAAHRQHHPARLRVLLAAAAPVYDPAAAKQLLAEAGYPQGFDAGDYYCDASYANLGEAVVNNLQDGRHPRASCGRSSAPPSSSGYAEKKFKNIIQGAQRRLRQRRHADRGLRRQGRRLRLRQLPRHRRAVPAAGGRARPRSGARRSCTGSSSSCTSKAIYAPIWQLAFLNGVGPAGRRVGRSA